MPDPTGRISHLPDMHRGMAWKQPVRAASTGALTLSGTQTIDGVACVAEDRVLYKDGTTLNGIWIVKAGAWVRAFDMDQDGTTSVPASEVLGAIVYVVAGTANGGTLWRCTNTTTPILGTTALTFAQVATSGYTPGGTDVAVADGGTGASTAAGARTNLGLVIGTDIDARVMTTAGDLIVGGVSGAAARLAKGSDGQVLTVDPTTHLLVWATPAGGALTTKGDLLGYSTVAARVPIGTNGDVLTADSAQTLGLKWAAPTGGGGSISSVDQDISADFTTASDSAWHDITGLTGISLVAGTWIGMIDIEIYVGVAVGPVFRVYDGTTTYAQAGELRNAPVAAVSFHYKFHMQPRVLGSTTTMAIQVYSDTVFTIKQYPTRGGLSTAVASHVTFLKIA